MPVLARAKREAGRILLQRLRRDVDHERADRRVRDSGARRAQHPDDLDHDILTEVVEAGLHHREHREVAGREHLRVAFRFGKARRPPRPQHRGTVEAEAADGLVERQPVARSPERETGREQGKTVGPRIDQVVERRALLHEVLEQRPSGVGVRRRRVVDPRRLELGRAGQRACPIEATRYARSGAAASGRGNLSGLPNVEEVMGVQEERDADSTVVETDFDETFPDMFRAAYRIVFRLLGSREDAADCAQEACARACADWSKLIRTGSPVPWTVRVSSNLAIDRLRHRAAREPTRSQSGWSSCNPTRRASTSIARSTASPAVERDIVVLRHLADLSEADVAALVGCSVGTVKSNASRAPPRCARC